MSKILLFFGIFFYSVDLALAQTSEDVILDSQDQVYFHGLPVGWFLYVVLIIISGLWGYIKKNESIYMKGIGDLIGKHVDNEMMKTALAQLIEIIKVAVEATYKDLYKEMKAVASDRKLTVAERDQLLSYAKLKIKQFLPSTLEITLSKMGLLDDNFITAKIEEILKDKKRANSISKILDGKLNIDKG